ncbi:hypothetical protein COCMIDRAFT_10115 [Bipolaris oryzae ATCC 44560]|uniref:Uncharacterized protein n=1 Tax=Bipolaris oryzae ATCC 44560 TaxID=930090 RepID=W6YQV1_COCMI|nr:uncharacterized protein COCMIDRAFT_10115 [Bipolaris oryzae ATCC 44560]EUC39893.1 hypothetical protein COCMIDRAFT_10115 [Bipolaris oryzae ATCC 44560]
MSTRCDSLQADEDPNDYATSRKLGYASVQQGLENSTPHSECDQDVAEIEYLNASPQDYKDEDDEQDQQAVFDYITS